MPSNGRWIVRRRRKFGFGFSATRHALTSRRRSAEHSYESAQEFFTAVGLSYLRSAGRRRRGTILDTSAGAGTCSDFSLSFSPCLSPPLLSLSFSLRLILSYLRREERREGRTKRKVREKERRGPVFLVFHLRNLAISLLSRGLLSLPPHNETRTLRAGPSDKTNNALYMYVYAPRKIVLAFWYAIKYVTPLFVTSAAHCIAAAVLSTSDSSRQLFSR